MWGSSPLFAPVTKVLDEYTRLSDTRRAVGFMLLSVLGYSLIPLVIELGAGNSNPFHINIGFRVGVVLTSVSYLLLRHRNLFLNRHAIRLVPRWLLKWSTILLVLPSLDYAFFAWSLRYVDSIVTVLFYELWALWFILIMARLFRTTTDTPISRYSETHYATWVLGAYILVGFVFVTYGSVGTLPQVINSQLFAGLLLATLAGLVGGISGYGFRWASDVRSQLPSHIAPPGGERDSAELALTVFVQFVSAALSIPLSVLLSWPLGIASGEGSDSLAVVPLLISVGGGIIVALSGLCWKFANLKTIELDINLMYYLTPVFAIAWLWWQSDIQIARLDFVAIGATAILSGNLLLRMNPDRTRGGSRYSFISLTLSLWLFGTIIFFRDSTSATSPILWTGGEFWGALSLSATIFILLLSFREARLSDRLRDEEATLLILFRKVEALMRRGLLPQSILVDILNIDTATGSRGQASRENGPQHKRSDPRRLIDPYRKARKVLEDTRTKLYSERDDLELGELAAQLDHLVRCKLYGREFGEIVALSVFAVIPITLSLAARPESIQSPWTGLLTEGFVVLFASTIAYLIMNSLDQHRERGLSVIQREPATSDVLGKPQEDFPRYVVTLYSSAHLSIERSIAIAVGSGMATVFGLLLYHYKWFEL